MRAAGDLRRGETGKQKKPSLEPEQFMAQLQAHLETVRRVAQVNLK